MLFIRPGGQVVQTVAGLVAEAGRYAVSFVVGRRLDRPFPTTAVAVLRTKSSNTVVGGLRVADVW